VALAAGPRSHTGRASGIIPSKRPLVGCNGRRPRSAPEYVWPDSPPRDAGAWVSALSGDQSCSWMSDEALSIGDLRAATLRGLRWAVFSRPVIELLNVASMVALARLVDPADFGRFAVALIVVDLTSITAQGVGVALVQRKTVTREHLQAGLALSMLSVLVVGGLIAAATRLVVEPIYGGRTADLVLLMVPVGFITAANDVPIAILQRRLEFRRLSAVQVIISVVTAATSVALAVAGMNGVALVLGTVAGVAVVTPVVWVWTCPPPPRLRRAAARDLLSYGGPASLAALGWAGFRNCDYAIVGARLGPLQAGFYYRAYTVAIEYQKKVSGLVSMLGFPLLARAESVDEQKMLRGRMVRMETLVLFPALLLLAIVAPVLIPWFFGDQWASATVPTQILAIGGAATLVIDAVGANLMATGRGRALLGYGWGHFAAYATAVFIASPFGIVAVAVAAAIVHGAFVIVAYVVLLQDHGVRGAGLLVRASKACWSDIQPATVSCAAIAAVAVPVALGLSSAQLPPLAFLAIVTAASAAAYLIALRLMFPSSLRSLGNLVAHLLPERRAKARPSQLAAADTRATS
jgi:lipopolysaccharide exporter